MTPPTIAERRLEVVTRGVPAKRAGWIETATSADHKTVAKLWMGTSMTFLAVTAVLFALTRIQLIVPDSTILSPEIFNRILTASSLTGIVPFALPFVIGLIGYIVLLQIGARSVALPRLNQFGYWLYTGRVHDLRQLPLHGPGDHAVADSPAVDDVFSPSNGVDAWIGGVGPATLGFVVLRDQPGRNPAKHASARPGLAPRSDLHGLRRDRVHPPRRRPGDAGGADNADRRPAVRRCVLRPRRGRRAALLAPELIFLPAPTRSSSWAPSA